jgi:hypothetical protein
VLILALTPLLGVAAATTVSLILRVGHTLADILLALRYGLVRARRNQRTATETTGESTDEAVESSADAPTETRAETRAES